MLVFLHLKATCDQFRLNRRQFRRCDDNVCVCREHRCHVTIDGQTANETPLSMAIQNLDQQSEIATAAIRNRFEYFSCGHFGVRRPVATFSLELTRKAVTSHRTPNQSLSNIPAAPMPPPTHIVTMP